MTDKGEINSELNVSFSTIPGGQDFRALLALSCAWVHPFGSPAKLPDCHHVSASAWSEACQLVVDVADADLVCSHAQKHVPAAQ